MSKYFMSHETTLASTYVEVIQPFWKNHVKQGNFSGVSDIEIAYAYALNPQAIGSVVISTGRIESFIKYKEVIFDLYQNGYSVFIHDHRGQGLSGRMRKNTHLGYVESFEDYVADFKCFVDKFVLPNSQTKPLLLCHSMGSAIGAKFILTYPEIFQKVAYSAPMFGIRPALPHWFSKCLLVLHASLSSTDAYFFGQKNYQDLPFITNELTHSQIRYQLFREEYEQDSRLQLGGVTGKWLSAAAQAMDDIEYNADKFTVPSLVIQAGGDQIVDNKRQTKVANIMANCQFKVITGAKHELLAESDQYRTQCLTMVLDFFQ